MCTSARSNVVSAAAHPSLKAQIRDTRRTYRTPYTCGRRALDPGPERECSRSPPVRAPGPLELTEGCLRHLRASERRQKNKSEAGGGRSTVVVHWRGWYPCKAYPQPSAALQEQRVGASCAGQALSCANARPLRLAASQRALLPRPPAISRRNMMNAGGSAKERLVFGVMAAGAAIAGVRHDGIRETPLQSTRA